jgi:hypothetical protein
MRATLVAGIALLVVGIGAARAQSNLGAVLDLGGKKMSSEEAKALLSGGSVTGKTATGADMSATYDAAGKVAGRIVGAGGSFPMTGTWRIEDGGKVCGEVYVDSPPTGSTTRGCGYYFRAGERYFFSLSDADRGARVQERVFKR